MTKEQLLISEKNYRNVRKRLKLSGAIPNNGKTYVLHHIDETLRHNNIERYIQWNLYDLEVMEYGEHSKLHMTGKYFSEEHKRKISENHVGMTGKHHSEQTKQRMSEAYNELVSRFKGKHHSEEWKKKHSEDMKRRWLEKRNITKIVF